MKQLTKEDELIGKTIKATHGLAAEDEQVVITFNDDTFTILTALRWGESLGLGLDKNPIESYLAKKAGLITEDEYTRLREEEEKLWVTMLEESDINHLIKLMGKFPNVVKAWVAEGAIR